MIIVGDSSNEMQAGVALHKYLINDSKKRIKKENSDKKSNKSKSTSNSFCIPINNNENLTNNSYN